MALDPIRATDCFSIQFELTRGGKSDSIQTNTHTHKARNNVQKTRNKWAKFNSINLFHWFRIFRGSEVGREKEATAATERKKNWLMVMRFLSIVCESNRCESIGICILSYLLSLTPNNRFIISIREISSLRNSREKFSTLFYETFSSSFEWLLSVNVYKCVCWHCC